MYKRQIFYYVDIVVQENALRIHMKVQILDFFKIGPLKMLGDGALGARTAFLSQPYADDPSTCGIPVFTQETLDTMIGSVSYTHLRLDHDDRTDLHFIRVYLL